MSALPLLQGSICVSVACDTVARAIDVARGAGDFADVTEIRLDTLTDGAITPFVETLQGPLLFTNRADWEGGFFKGTETDLQVIDETIPPGQLDCVAVPVMNSSLCLLTV